MFNESEHPRDGDGKFTDKEGAQKGYDSRNDLNIIRNGKSTAPSQNNEIEASAKSSTLEMTDLERHHLRLGILVARNALDREYDKLDNKEDLTSKEIEQLDNIRQTLTLYDGIIKKLEAKT